MNKLKRLIYHRYTETYGIYVEIISFPGVQLQLDKLDNSSFHLHSCVDSTEGRESAVVFIPESRRTVFLRKLNEFLDPSKDSKTGRPRNHALINSISEIRLADLQAFWTDDPAKFPTNIDQMIWWELWLKKRDREDPLEIGLQLVDRLGITLGNTSQYYYDSAVILVRASVRHLEKAPELISSLEELRLASESPGVFVRSSPTEQQQWVDDLLERAQSPEEATTAVCVLDAGVNYHHPLLSLGSNANFAVCWDHVWPDYDPLHELLGPYNCHGSLQSGIALFGDVMGAVQSDEPVQLSHFIESVSYTHLTLPTICSV